MAAAHYRDDSELRRVLEAHEVRGYPVVAPIFGKSTVLSQAPTVGPFTYFLVQAKTPVPFGEWLQKKHISSEKMTQAELEERYEYGSRKLPHMQPELMEILEQGGKVSMADVEFSDLMARGCIDPDSMVHCQPFDSKSVFIDPRDLEPGMLVELDGSNVSIGNKNDVWPVRVVSVKGNELLADLLIPATYLRMPDALMSKKIKPGYHSKKTVAFGEGLAQAWEDQGEKLPPGEWSTDGHEYLLSEPLDSKAIDRFCMKHYPEEPHCTWQGLLMYVIPLNIDPNSEYSVRIRPLPEKSVPPEYVVPAIED